MKFLHRFAATSSASAMAMLGNCPFCQAPYLPLLHRLLGKRSEHMHHCQAKAVPLRLLAGTSPVTAQRVVEQWESQHPSS